MTTKPSARQVLSREALNRLSKTTNTEIDELLRSANAEITPPYELKADSSPAYFVNIGPSNVPNSETGTNRSAPAVGVDVPELVSGSIEFPANANGAVNIAPGPVDAIAIPNNQYMKVTIYVGPTHDLGIEKGTPNAIETNASAPAAPNGTLPLGYVTLFNDGGILDFITDQKIFQFVGNAPQAKGGPTPEGSIVAYHGGYHTDNANGGYQIEIAAGNSVAQVNAVIGPEWHVCDGSALNDNLSLIFDGPGRHLPNLTDSRFIQGSNSAGGTGGISTWNKSWLNSNQNFHYHDGGNLYAEYDIAPPEDKAYIGQKKLINWAPTVAVQGPINPLFPHDIIDSYNSVGGPYDPQDTGIQVSGTSAGTKVVWDSSEITNKPLYLSCYYIMKVRS